MIDQKLFIEKHYDRLLQRGYPKKWKGGDQKKKIPLTIVQRLNTTNLSWSRSIFSFYQQESHPRENPALPIDASKNKKEEWTF